MGVEIKARDFLCRHDDDGRARCDAVLAEALEILRGDFSPDFVEQNSTEALLWALGSDTREGVRVIADQWAAVSTGEDVWIQCDEITDGLAAAYLLEKRRDKV